MKIKYLNELNFESKHDKRMVYKWLRQCVKQLEKDISYNVRKCDFKNDELFYFTDCKDILSNKHKVKRRKNAVFTALFLRQINNMKIKIIKDVCTTCGHPEMDIDALDGGFYHYCPKCGKTVLHSDINGIQSTMGDFYRRFLKEEK